MNPKPIYLLSAPVRTGKTTALQNWADGNQGITGVLTPVVENRRLFLDLASGVRFDMEADVEEQDVLSVGRFRFSKAAFAKAIHILNQPPSGNEWRVIDEIGPLELQGEGFGPGLRKLLDDYDTNRMRLILVIRDTLLEKVCAHFRFDKFEMRIIGTTELPEISHEKY
jgi:nucleoside-triphosphatase THEP1